MEEIKAGDIMLNNWVEYDGKYYQVSALSEEYPFLNTDAFGVGVVTYRNIKGIPLTEDILLKAGFKVSMNKTCYGMITESGKTRLSIFHDGLFKVSCEDLEIKVKHLHQLQNLFKSLTGNDLKIEV